MATDLQRLNSKAQHDMYFKLQSFYTSHSLGYSNKTLRLVKKHNILVNQLRDSLKLDYAKARVKILTARQKVAGGHLR